MTYHSAQRVVKENVFCWGVNSAGKGDAEFIH